MAGIQARVRQYVMNVGAERTIHAAAHGTFTVTALPHKDDKAGKEGKFLGTADTPAGTRLRIEWTDTRNDMNDGSVWQLNPAMEWFLPPGAPKPPQSNKPPPPPTFAASSGKQEITFWDGPSIAYELFANAVFGDVAGTGLMSKHPQQRDSWLLVHSGLGYLVMQHPSLFWSMVLHWHAPVPKGTPRRALPPLGAAARLRSRDGVKSTVFDRDWDEYLSRGAHALSAAKAAGDTQAATDKEASLLTAPSRAVSLYAVSQLQVESADDEQRYPHALELYHKQCASVADIPSWVAPFEELYGGALERYLAADGKKSGFPCIFGGREGTRVSGEKGCLLAANCPGNHTQTMAALASLRSVMKRDAEHFRANLAERQKKMLAEVADEVEDAGLPCAQPTCPVHHKCKQETQLLRCGRCRNAFYCSAECQKAHWKEHKPHCRKEEPGKTFESAWALVLPADTRSPYPVAIPANGEGRLRALLRLLGIADPSDAKNTKGNGGVFSMLPVRRGESLEDVKTLAVFHRTLPDECPDSARMGLGTMNQLGSALVSKAETLVCIAGARVPVRGDAVVVRFSALPRVKAGTELPPLADFGFDAYVKRWGTFAIQEFCQAGEQGRLMLASLGIEARPGEVYARSTVLPRSEETQRLVGTELKRQVEAELARRTAAVEAKKKAADHADPHV